MYIHVVAIEPYTIVSDKLVDCLCALHPHTLHVAVQAFNWIMKVLLLDEQNQGNQLRFCLECICDA